MEIKQLGQLMMIGVEGPRLNASEKKFLQRVDPAGVIYFRRNVESSRQLMQLTLAIQKELDTPPMIGIDQEGGRVARLGPPFTLFPGNDFLGRIFLRSGKTDLAVAQAKAMAAELKAIGINLNFTPVADVASNPRNPIIGPRSFGKTAPVVSKLVAATVRAYNQSKMISCAKHFPGHGDTHSDSHKVLPTVKASRAAILRREIPPFRAAIRAGVPTLMTAHVIYPALDPKRTATQSEVILQGLLRKKLGFRGVIISDDLEMNAIAAHQKLGEAAVEAICAGVDLLLVCKSLSEAGAIYERLAEAARRKEIPTRQLAASIRRIAALKKRFLGGRSIARRTPPSDSTFSKHRRLAEKIESLGAPNFRRN